MQLLQEWSMAYCSKKQTKHDCLIQAGKLKTTAKKKMKQEKIITKEQQQQKKMQRTGGLYQAGMLRVIDNLMH